MGSREERKAQREKTSRSLIEAALALSAEDGYSSLTLRSVARKAGIAPTSFYRHFRDLDELGTAMIKEADETFSTCMNHSLMALERPFVDSGSPGDLSHVVRISVERWVQCLIEEIAVHDALMRLYFQERTGSSAQLRNAIADSLERQITLLANTLTKQGDLGFKFSDLNLTAEIMMTLVCAGAMSCLVGAQEVTLTIGRVTDSICLVLFGALLCERSGDE